MAAAEMIGAGPGDLGRLVAAVNNPASTGWSDRGIDVIPKLYG